MGKDKKCAVCGSKIKNGDKIYEDSDFTYCSVECTFAFNSIYESIFGDDKEEK